MVFKLVEGAHGDLIPHFGNGSTHGLRKGPRAPSGLTDRPVPTTSRVGKGWLFMYRISAAIERKCGASSRAPKNAAMRSIIASFSARMRARSTTSASGGGIFQNRQAGVFAGDATGEREPPTPY